MMNTTQKRSFRRPHTISHINSVSIYLCKKKKKVEMKKGYNSSLCVYYMYKVSTKGMTTGDYSYAHLQIP